MPPFGTHDGCTTAVIYAKENTMNTYIALLRGVNVGGSNKLPMRDLAALLQELGLQSVKTYIQSGNAVFQSEQTNARELSESITAAIHRSKGFAPYTLILTQEELAAAAAANPFPEGEAEPKTLHLFFLDGIPQAYDPSALERVKAPDERYQLIGRVFYLHAPAGIGRSKLAETAGKGWRVNITARNWRTVCEILALARGLSLPDSRSTDA
jgi:uncharacterized protein (DUF1697 family)